MAIPEPRVIGTVALPELAGARGGVLWPALMELAARLPRPWVIIGGQMVFLHGALAGRAQPRVTHDIDLLFDIRAEVTAIRRAAALLHSLGYQVDGMSPDQLAHRYRRADGVLVDLLAPDKLGRRADLTTTRPGRTIEVPGTTGTSMTSPSSVPWSTTPTNYSTASAVRVRPNDSCPPRPSTIPDTAHGANLGQQPTTRSWPGHISAQPPEPPLNRSQRPVLVAGEDHGATEHAEIGNAA